MGRGTMGSDAGDKYAVSALGGPSGGKRELALPGASPNRGGGDVEAGGLDKDSIMKFYKKRTILPQEKLGAAADLKRNTKDMGFAQDDFRLDPEEVRGRPSSYSVQGAPLTPSSLLFPLCRLRF